jgi:AcrR family transcriptional regulator
LGRKATIEDVQLMRRLEEVFRDVGYDGATLTALSKATGLQKASLYHRFPGGKEQMAQEVLQVAGLWLEVNLLAPLRDRNTLPKARIELMVRRLDEFYSGGKQACLLNLLSTASPDSGPFGKSIKALIDAWVTTLSSLLLETGLRRKAATARAERAMVGLQGSLVVSRGLGTTRPFKDYLRTLPAELLQGREV